MDLVQHVASDAHIPALFTAVREALRQHVTQELLDHIVEKAAVLRVDRRR